MQKNKTARDCIPKTIPHPSKINENDSIAFIDELIKQKRIVLDGQLESLQLSIHMFNIRTAKA